MDTVPALRGLVLPLLSTAHLLFLLRHWPGLGDTPLVIDLLCSRDLHAAITYLLSLPYSHGHRQEMKKHLRKHLLRISIKDFPVFASLFPPLTALVTDEDGVLRARVGPLDDIETGLWDSNDFFFGVMHARNMEGTIPFACYHFCMSFITFSNATLRFL